MNSRSLNKITGPLMLILGPVWLIVMVPAGIRAQGTVEQPTVAQWAIIIGSGVAAILIGFRFCEQEYGLVSRIFKRK